MGICTFGYVETPRYIYRKIAFLNIDCVVSLFLYYQTNNLPCDNSILMHSQRKTYCIPSTEMGWTLAPLIKLLPLVLSSLPATQVEVGLSSKKKPPSLGYYMCCLCIKYLQQSPGTRCSDFG